MNGCPLSFNAADAEAIKSISALHPRRLSLDIIRTIAIFTVVLIHVFQSTYAGTPGMGAGGSLPLAMATYLGRLGVPLFLFLSGTLLLNKRFENDTDVLRFYRHNFLPLLLTVEVWCSLYTFWLWGTGAEDADPLVLLTRLLFFEQLPVAHWWYMPMILGIYLVVPLIAMVVQRVSFKIAAVPLVIVSINCILIPTINGVLEPMGIRPVDTMVLDSTFYGGNYGIYLVLGYYLDRCGLLRRVPGWALVIGFGVSAYLGVYEGFVGISLWYNNLWVFLGALLLFELLSRRDADGALCQAGPVTSSRAVALVTWVSTTSFGIYLCHMMFLPYVQAVFASIGPIAIRSLICTLILFGVSIAFVSLVRLAVPLRRALFDMK